MKKIIIIIQIIYSLLIACNPAKPDQIQIHNPHDVFAIENIDKDKYFEWEPKINIDKIIPLESNANAFIGYLNKGVITNNTIFIHDNRNQLLKSFNTDGKFLSQVGLKGKGPGEYLEMRDFMVLKSDILCLDYEKIHCYDLKTGKYNYSINIQIDPRLYNPNKFLVLDTSNIYLWESNPSSLSEDDTKYCLLKYQNKKISASYFKWAHRSFDENRFYHGVNGSFIIRPLDGEYKIYKIDHDSLFLYFELDFKSKSLPMNYFENHPVNKNNEYLQSDYYKSISNIFETENHIYFYCNGPGSFGYEGLIDKRNKKVSFGKHNFNISPRIFYSDNNFLYGYYESRSFVTETPPDKSRDFFKRISQNLGSINLEDNLILLKFSIRDN
jgi:hypothetical protein